MGLESVVGELRGELKGALKEIDRHTDQLDSIEMKLNVVLEHINQTKGGWKVICILAGVSASFGAFIAWIIKTFNIFG